MVLAYDFPLLGLFWTVLWMSFVFSIFFGIVWSFIDNFRRADHHGWAKAGWAMFILLLPVIGMFCYIVARPVAMSRAEVAAQATPGVSQAA